MSTYMERSQRSELDPGTTLDQARERFGRPFAHEMDSAFVLSAVPFLTRYQRDKYALPDEQDE